MAGEVLKFQRESYANKLLFGEVYDRLKRLEVMAGDHYGEYAGMIVEIAIRRYMWQQIPESTGIMLDNVEENVFRALNEELLESGADFWGELV
jgi:hypothetical protein